MTPSIGRLAVIGVGLIGGSLARALRAVGAVDEVVGCGRGKANLEQAIELGVIDRYTHDIGEAVAGADLVFLAIPLGAMREAFIRMRDALPATALVTDGGSAKGSVVEDCRSVAPQLLARLVPGHPMRRHRSARYRRSDRRYRAERCRRIVCGAIPASAGDSDAAGRECAAVGRPGAWDVGGMRRRGYRDVGRAPRRGAGGDQPPATHAGLWPG